MHPKTILLIYCLVSVTFINVSIGQNISSRLTLSKDLLFKAGGIIDKVELKTILYGSSGSTETRQSVHYFNKYQKALRGQTYYIEGDLKSSYENEYKNDTLLIRRSIISSGRYVRRDKSVIEYQYDQNNHLIRQVKTEGSTDIYQEIEYENDERGNPIKLVIDKGKYGHEVAKYDYRNNIVYKSVINNEDDTVSTSKSIIYNAVQNPRYQYNEYGEVVEDDRYKFHYKYDKKGNWIKQTRRSKMKNMTDAVITRKITYQ